MSRLLATLAFSAGILAALNSTAFSQTNLTAKATPPQPGPVSVVSESDRTRDGLMGPVRRVRTEVAKLLNENGKVTEAKHAVLEVVAYDQNGAKMENQYFPIAGATLTGKEVYKYDEKGNISEMTLLNADGSLMSKETYKYEYDFAGNWNKMTTSVAVFEGGKLSFEPTEVTYRSITYYLDDKILRMAQPQATASNNPAASPANSSLAKSQDTKNTTALPAAINPDKLNNANSIDFVNKNVTAGSQPVTVKLDSEPPPPAPKPMLRPVSGGVLNGTAVSLPPPTYPEAAKRMRQSGVVTVSVIVDETGKVISAQATDGPSALRDVAVQAALRARFSPTKLSGQPVKVSGLINYKFSLTQ